ncbi:MAG: PIN domain-containing protein [Steroidobacteraceae bacterium]
MLLTRGFMLDTSTINWILDQEVSAGDWTLRGPVVVTDVQLLELMQTPLPERRESLLGVLSILRPSVILPDALAPMAYDFGLGLEEETYQRSLGRQARLMAAALGDRFERNFRDALIAEAALANALTLVTADAKLARMARSFGIGVEAIH